MQLSPRAYRRGVISRILGFALFPPWAATFAELPKPTPQQYAWQEQERTLFVCLDPATWQGRESDNHPTPPLKPVALP